jgi:hypothetical protein
MKFLLILMVNVAVLQGLASKALATVDPPLDRVADPVWQWVVFAVAAVAFLAIAGYGELERRRGGTPVLLLATIGGAIAIVGEPMWDLVARLYMFESGACILFTIGGRGMQLWAPFGYAAYIGPTVYIFYRLTTSPTTTRRTFWLACGAIMCLNLLIEIPATRMNLYEYYGPQAFNPTGFPLYWLLSNLPAAAVSGVLLGRVPELTRGWRALSILLMVPSFFIAGEFFVQWPAFAAVGARNSGYVLTYAGALVTIGIGITVLRVLADLTVAGAEQARERLKGADSDISAANP